MVTLTHAHLKSHLRCPHSKVSHIPPFSHSYIIVCISLCACLIPCLLPVSYSNLASTLPGNLFSTSNSYNWLLGLRELDLSHCGLVGSLPNVDIGFTALSGLDLSYNNFTGTIPQSFGNFLGLRELRLEGNPGLINTTGHGLPLFLIPASDGSSTTNSSGGYSCPNLRIRPQSSIGASSSEATFVTLDPTYYHHTLCSCLDTWFGSNAHCQRCGEECTCRADIIRDCYPVRRVDEESGQQEYFFLPCPLTLTSDKTHTRRHTSSVTVKSLSLDLTNYIRNRLCLIVLLCMYVFQWFFLVQSEWCLFQLFRSGSI